MIKKAGRFEDLLEERLRKARCISRAESVGGKLETGIGRPSARP